ncbi:MAG: hypothetical protein J4N81_09255 [Chloroflexi bacterium]|nr:hypothetical protein [Chloroflexota bacterium]
MEMVGAPEGWSVESWVGAGVPAGDSVAIAAGDGGGAVAGSVVFWAVPVVAGTVGKDTGAVAGDGFGSVEAVAAGAAVAGSVESAGGLVAAVVGAGLCP